MLQYWTPAAAILKALLFVSIVALTLQIFCGVVPSCACSEPFILSCRERIVHYTLLCAVAR